MLAEAHELFAVFEDDLWLAPGFEHARNSTPSAQSPLQQRQVRAAAARERMSAAVASLPRSADVLYLEMCGENCADLRYARGNNVVARARNTFCSAAMLFTTRGAQRVLDLTLPIFDGLDLMLAGLWFSFVVSCACFSSVAHDMLGGLALFFCFCFWQR
jgi:hypothetical protein